MSPDQRQLSPYHRFLHKIIGPPKDVEDKHIWHKISLIPILAWIGLGADGLSSSSYGPDEAFRTLGQHAYLATVLGLGTVFTGKLFRHERFFSKLLHNETAFAIQRRLQWDGITTVILPIRVDM